MARAASAESVDLWQQRIDSHARSGLSVVGFCKAHGLQPHNFYFWRRKLAKSGARARRLSSCRHSNGDNSSRSTVSQLQLNCEEQVRLDSVEGLLPLRVVSGLPSTSVCIRFASGIMVEAPVEMACQPRGFLTAELHDTGPHTAGQRCMRIDQKILVTFSQNLCMSTCAFARSRYTSSNMQEAHKAHENSPRTLAESRKLVASLRELVEQQSALMAHSAFFFLWSLVLSIVLLLFGA